MAFFRTISDYQAATADSTGRDCNLRYEVIKKHIPNSSYQMSFLDIGSNLGIFSMLLAKDFNANVYSIEHYKPDYLFHLKKIQSEKIDNNYIFSSILNFEILSELFKGQKVFDVVLLLSVLHHFHYDLAKWSKLVGLFIKHSRLTFIELPSLDEGKEVIAALDKFKSWYSKYPADHYQSLLKDVLNSEGIQNCEISTIKGSTNLELSPKEVRHIILIKNNNITEKDVRYNSIDLANCQEIFMIHPSNKVMGKILFDFKGWLCALPKRIISKIK